MRFSWPSFLTLSLLGGIASGRPYSQLTATVSNTTQYEAYLFAYFTGDTIEGEKIYFAVSNGNNALDWTELNNGEPSIASTQGTLGLRDPFMIRSQDGSKAWLVATDLSIGSGTTWPESYTFGSRYLEIWESTDLVNWGEQRHVLVSPPSAGMTWAPEAYFDDTIGEYVVHWSSRTYPESDTNRTGPAYSRIWYATTADFATFSEPRLWQDEGGPTRERIDSTVVRDETGTYHRFTKSIGGAGPGGCVDIVHEKSPNLRATLQDWEVVATCIGRSNGFADIEGPDAFHTNSGDVNGDKWYLFVDEFGGRGYLPLETTDINNPEWKLASSYNLPRSPRHGTVLPITKEELARLQGP
ncbi:glycosyl hydrolase [Elsinoe ampelina]|uniref:Glycosyl hydrolase n=1 Tax=Elsinoe ampelina TaxID=302913 RepID=A0A6A6GIX2_9PEZI|nr:glycosyl hydrolase [Elsinoe ampelina]